MVSVGNLIGELKLSGKFSKQISALITIYAGWWVVSQIIAIIVIAVVYANYGIVYTINQINGSPPPTPINLFSFMNGFTLFSYFPVGLRFIMYIYILGAILSFPFFAFTAVLWPPPKSYES